MTCPVLALTTRLTWRSLRSRSSSSRHDRWLELLHATPPPLTTRGEQWLSPPLTMMMTMMTMMRVTMRTSTELVCPSFSFFSLFGDLLPKGENYGVRGVQPQSSSLSFPHLRVRCRSEFESAQNFIWCNNATPYVSYSLDADMYYLCVILACRLLHFIAFYLVPAVMFYFHCCDWLSAERQCHS